MMYNYLILTAILALVVTCNATNLRTATKEAKKSSSKKLNTLSKRVKLALKNVKIPSSVKMGKKLSKTAKPAPKIQVIYKIFYILLNLYLPINFLGFSRNLFIFCSTARI